MPSQSQQLTLDLPHRPALGAEDFFLSRSNQHAVALIDSWPSWPEYGTILVGPAACGKSHLVNVWRLHAGADLLLADALDQRVLGTLPLKCAIVIEDVDRRLVQEDALFHLLNIVKEQGGSLLLTSRDPALCNKVQLRDLRSRLQALPSVAIETPDDDLLKAVMVKQFGDRQLEIDPTLVEYLMKRVERSFVAVADIVAELDRASLGSGRKITRQLARQLLENIG